MNPYVSNRRFLLLASLVALIGMLWAAQAAWAAPAAAPSAATRYVSPAGMDAGDCTNPGSPCKTIDYARQQSSPGDTISLAAGIYSENVNLFQDTWLTGAGAGLSVIDGGGSGASLTIYAGNVVTVTGVTIQNGSNSYGGGIVNNGNLHVRDSAVSNNYASNSAGGIYNTGVLTVTRTTISNNTAYSTSGGIGNFGSTTVVVDSTLSGNKALTAYGGAVHNNSGTTMTMTNVTVSDNRAPAGAGLSTSGSLFLNNVTVAFNIATNNFGGGISNYGSVTSFMTIVGSNIGGNQCDGTGSFSSNGYNLSSDASCGFASGGDLQNTDPLLAPLQNYTSPTMTHSPYAGSPAIDGGTNSSCPPADQRGVARPINGGVSNTCDIGAHEYNPATDKPKIFLPVVIRD